MSEKSLFDRLYDETDKALQVLKKPLIKKQMKRKLATAFDSAENKIIDAETALQDLRGDFKNYDVNKVLEQNQIIDANKELQKTIAEEYLKMFGKALPTNE